MANRQFINGNDNISIKDVNFSEINITQYLVHSKQYNELILERGFLQNCLIAIPEDKISERYELSKKIEGIQKQIESLEEDAEALYNRILNTYLDSERLKKVKDLVKIGKFEEANEILKSNVLESEQQHLFTIKKKLEIEIEKSEEGLKKNAEEFLIKAQITALDYSNSNWFENTKEFYQKSITSHESEENLFEYASFLKRHNELKEAENVYYKILEILGGEAFIYHHSDKKDSPIEENQRADLSNIVVTLHYLANLHSKNNEFSVAEKEYKEALIIIRRLAEENSSEYLPILAMILNDFALLHAKINEHVVAEEDYGEALIIIRGLLEENPKEYFPELAMVLNNLALSHQQINKLTAAEEEYREAVKLYRDFSEENPRKYLPILALTLSNLARLHQQINKLTAAEEEYREAVKLFRGIAEKNPRAYNPYLAAELSMFAKFHTMVNENTIAEEEYREAVKLFRGLVKENSKEFLPALAITLSNLANLHLKNNEYAAAEEEREEALGIKRELVEANQVFENIYIMLPP